LTTNRFEHGRRRSGYCSAARGNLFNSKVFYWLKDNGQKAFLLKLACAAFWLVVLPPVCMAELASYYAEPPDTVFASNTVIDIIEHAGGIWFATGEGLNFSMDSGRTWLLYNSTNGLVSDNLSAIYSMNNRIWVATNHESGGYTISDGLSYSDDTGNTWTQVNFGSEGLNIPYVWGGDRTIFDITGHRVEDRNIDWLFFTAFAGGFLASQDGGLSWRRIYSSPSDSGNFVRAHLGQEELRLRNRYFSCVVDTSHGDSLYVWAGTAGGVFQYVYAIPREKPYSKMIKRIAFCDQCPDTPSFVYFAGDNGVTRGTTQGGPYIHRSNASVDIVFQPDGLPGSFVTALVDFRGKLFVGTMDKVDSTSTGLAVSTDQGDTYTPLSSFTEVIGPKQRILDFAVIRERLYLAAEEAGLFVSVDTGETWVHMYVDSSDTTSNNRRNVVHALNALADTLRVGTDSGYVALYLDSTGQIDSSFYHVFAESDSSSAKVIRIKTQSFYDTTGLILDSVAIWTVNRPITAGGIPVVFRSYHDTILFPGEILWRAMQGNLNVNDINFLGDSAFAVSEIGLRFTVTGEDPTLVYPVEDSISNDNFDNDVITVMEVKGDTIFIGTDNGFAISNDRGESYKIQRVNTDSLGADLVVNFASNVYGITSDFIPALGVQYIDGEYARVWVSNHPLLGTAAISVGLVTPVDSFGYPVHPDSLEKAVGYERRWEAVDTGSFAWNFAFNGDSVFAATDGGLLFNYGDTGRTWDTIQLVDTAGNPLVLPNMPVYAVEVIDDFLWVGTEDGTVRIDLGNLTGNATFVYVDSTTSDDIVYAFPIPLRFSEVRDRVVDFHFVVKSEAYITIEIYDFAMNLVKRIVDNAQYPAGLYHRGGPNQGGPLRPTWDGTNGSGENVAVGTYYFKVEYSTGEMRWGKIAVIP
jgi:ligand-binding sensor domain-containing protein